VSTTKKTKVESTPWVPGESYIKDSLSGMQTANQQGTANLNANMGGLNSAIAQINQNVAAPPAYLTDARANLDKTINGDFVGKNPYIDHAADLVAQKTGAQYESSFGGAGRAHGGLAALLSSQGVGDALNGLYGQQYNQERGLQQQAIMAAPGFHQDQQQTDIGALIPGINASAMLPGQVAGQYAAGVTNATSPYGTKTQTEKSSMLPQLLGMAAQIGGAAFGEPVPPMSGGGFSGVLSQGQNSALNGAFGPIGSSGWNFGLGG
jgi:hypothetical protein